MIEQYLRYGCANAYPTVETTRPLLADPFHIKRTLFDKIDAAISKVSPENTVFQLSGGFDSSVVVSYFEGAKTFCTGSADSFDKGYSQRVADIFHTDHVWMSHDELLSRIDFKEAIIEMAKINRHPRCYRNDFGLYAFLKYVKDHADNVVSGKGIEFQMLGYYSLYNRIIEQAIGIGE